MDWLKKNPEKAILMAVALVALGLGAKHLVAVQGYAASFDLPTAGKKGKALPEPPEALMEKSAALVELPLFWSDKTITIPGSAAEKKVPLLCSVYIVEKEGKLFDLANPNTEALRPPVPNAWILGHQLEILNPKVLEMDADSDGFSNLEEWEAKTEPLKRDSHPPYTDKLFFASRPQIDLYLRFAAANPPDFQVSLMIGQRTISTDFYKVGQSFPSNPKLPPMYNQKFTLLNFRERKDAEGMDVSELEVRDNGNQKMVAVSLKSAAPCPIYAVDFEFPLGNSPEEQKFRVQEGSSFRLSLDPDTEYTLVSAEADSATIRKAGSPEPIVIRKQ